MTKTTYSPDSLPLEAVAGHCLMVGFSGAEPPEALLGRIARGLVGGVILFKRNLKEPAQVRRLCQSLQEAAASSPGAVPLWISVDQEGGRVVRLSAPFTVPPPARQLAEGGEEAVSDLARRVAGELMCVGINMNLAPVLDVDTNPLNPIIADRAFSSDTGECSRLGAAYVGALQAEGCAACAKHFPGHGDTATDSHLILPVVDHGRERLEAVELKPFRAAIRSGAAAVMTAHVLYPRLDTEEPATFSRPIIEGLLRAELGYGGCVITDDLDMRAVADEHSLEEAAVRALRAGCDVALVCGSEEAAPRMHSALLEAVRGGALSEERLRQACGRVLAAKALFAAPPAMDFSDVESRLGLA